MELPPDNRADEITLQLVECSVCSFRGLAVFAESRRGPWPDSSIEHTVYDLPDGEEALVRALFERCPNRRNAHCQCAIHRALGHQDNSGRWIGLNALRHGAAHVLARE